MRMPFLFGAEEHAVVAMEEEDCIAAERLHAEDFGRPWSTEEFADLLAQATVFGFVARPVGGDRRQTSGFVLARLAAGEGEILTVAVARAQRQAGIGRRLMDAVLRHLHAERADALFLEVDETNVPALALYRRLGFGEVARRPGYYQDPSKGRTDALVMRRDLRRPGT